MVRLKESEIKTSEVLGWQGLHLLHFRYSSCSIKTRIFLNLKGGNVTLHEVNIRTNENWSRWFLGINPRGLVPVLIDDGAVHIESNDILSLLDERLPGERLIPADYADSIQTLLKHEDELHIDLRTVSFRFNKPKGIRYKSEDLIQHYRDADNSPEHRSERARELAFYEEAGDTGISDKAALASLAKFQAEFARLDESLARHPYLMGDRLTVLDIAWFVYVNRLETLGYPVARLHPHLGSWLGRLMARPEFTREVTMRPEDKAALDDTLAAHAAAGQSLRDLAGF